MPKKQRKRTQTESNEIKAYEKLVEKEKGDKDFNKEQEVTLAENLAIQDLNEATRGNAGADNSSAVMGERFRKYWPKWLKFLVLLFILFWLAFVAINIISIFLK